MSVCAYAVFTHTHTHTSHTQHYDGAAGALSSALLALKHHTLNYTHTQILFEVLDEKSGYGMCV
jgi:hypothetical protein